MTTDNINQRIEEIFWETEGTNSDVLKALIKEITDREEKLREALEFYANISSPKDYVKIIEVRCSHIGIPIKVDGYEVDIMESEWRGVAKQALQQTKE